MLAQQWVTERFQRSAEDGASLLLLADLYRALPGSDQERPRLIDAARRLAAAIEEWVYPEARWIDAEVYFSCSPKPLDFRDARSGQWPQNTLCMHLTAAGFLALHGLTAEPRHLALARRALDRLILYQQVWDPPFLHFRGVGGYGSMNTDGELVTTVPPSLARRGARGLQVMVASGRGRGGEGPLFYPREAALFIAAAGCGAERLRAAALRACVHPE